MVKQGSKTVESRQQLQDTPLSQERINAPATSSRLLVDDSWQGHDRFVVFLKSEFDKSRVASPAQLIRVKGDLEYLDEHCHIISALRAERIVGYAATLKLEAGVLHEVLDQAECLEFNYYYNKNEQPVNLYDLTNYSGFSEYKGKGAVVFIHKLESFEPKQGIGTQLIDSIICNPDNELVFLHARDTQAVDFFENRGFVHSGVFAGPKSTESVLVFHNRK